MLKGVRATLACKPYMIFFTQCGAYKLDDPCFILLPLSKVQGHAAGLARGCRDSARSEVAQEAGSATDWPLSVGRRFGKLRFGLAGSFNGI